MIVGSQLRLPRPDLSIELGVPNACIGCHRQQSHEWAALQIRAHAGREPDAHFASVLASARQGKQQAKEPLHALAADKRQPAIVRATGLGLLGHYDPSAQELQLAIADADPLVRLGALRGLAAAAPVNWQVLMPVLKRSAACASFCGAHRLVAHVSPTACDCEGSVDACD